MLDLNGMRLRNRVVTSASLLGLRRETAGGFPYGLSPVAQFLPLERFGAVTTRTVTFEPREGHFTTRTDWRVRDWPGLDAPLLGRAAAIDGGWMNAFGWSNIGIEAYFDGVLPADERPEPDRLPRRLLRRRVRTARRLRATSAPAPGEIAAVEFNVSCHNVNFASTRSSRRS